MLTPRPAPSSAARTSALESKFTALDLKSISHDGAFEGYASLFHREDLGRDLVLPGAFRDSLARRGATGIKLLFQHKPDEPIGVWQHLAEDARGLYARGRLMLDIARGREVHSLMRAGAIDGLSIGFRALKARRDRVSGIRRLEKVDLWEISVVTFPMLPEARVAVVKQQPPAAGPGLTTRELERRLTHDAGLTRSQARALLRHGLDGLARTHDAAADPHDEASLAASLRAAARLLRSSLHVQRT